MTNIERKSGWLGGLEKKCFKSKCSVLSHKIYNDLSSIYFASVFGKVHRCISLNGLSVIL